MADPRRSHIHQLPSADSQGAQAGRAASPEGLLQQFLARTQQQQQPGWGDAARYDLERLQATGQGIMANTQAAAQANQDHLLPKPSPEANWLQRMLYNATAAQANAGVHQSNLAQGAAMHALDQMAENEGLVQSWVNPLEGPSRAVGAAIMGQNPFVDGHIEGLTVSEALMERGAPPWLAIAAEFLVPDPTGVGRVADLIPLTSAMLVGFRGLKSLVPNSTSDYHAALKLFEGSSDLTRTAPELGPEELRLVSQQVLQASTRGDASSQPIAELTAHALRLQERANGLEYAAANPAADLPMWRIGEDGWAVGGLQPTDVIPALGDLAIQGRTVNIADPGQRSLALESIDSELTNYLTTAQGNYQGDLASALLAASAYPDEKGRLASQLLRQLQAVGSGGHADDLFRTRIASLRQAFSGASASLRDSQHAAELLRQAEAAGLHGSTHNVPGIVKDLDFVGQQAQSALADIIEASSQDVLGLEFMGEAMANYEDVLRSVAQARDYIHTRYLADALEPVPPDVMALLEEVTRGLDTGSEDGFVAVFHTVRDFAHSPGEVRQLLHGSLRQPERVPPELMDEAVNYVWEIVNGDPTNFNSDALVTWRPGMALEHRAGTVPPESLRGLVRDLAPSLGMSESELAKMALEEPELFRTSTRLALSMPEEDVENLRLYLADTQEFAAGNQGLVQRLASPEQAYDAIAESLGITREQAIQLVLDPNSDNATLLKSLTDRWYPAGEAEAALRTLKGLPPADLHPLDIATWKTSDSSTTAWERWRQQAANELEASGEMSAPGPLGDRPLDAWLQDRYKMLEQQAGLSRDALISELELGGGQAVQDLLELFGFSDEAIDTIIDDLRQGLDMSPAQAPGGKRIQPLSPDASDAEAEAWLDAIPAYDAASDTIAGWSLVRLRSGVADWVNGGGHSQAAPTRAQAIKDGTFRAIEEVVERQNAGERLTLADIKSIFVSPSRLREQEFDALSQAINLESLWGRGDTSRPFGYFGGM